MTHTPQQPGRGTTRRVRELLRRGWSRRRIAEHLGIPSRRVAQVVCEDRRRDLANQANTEGGLVT